MKIRAILGTVPWSTPEARMERYVLIHYDEIALKGKNRLFFENKLRVNLRAALRPVDCGKSRRLFGRILVDLPRNVSWEEVRGRVEKVFGVAYFAEAFRIAARYERLEEAVKRLIEGRRFRTFAVRARRAEKQFALTSMEINRRLGSAIQSWTGAGVDLGHPELEVFVEILSKDILIYFEKVRGARGLPVGASGKVLCLLSGGIDSPVAAYRMMRRGCTVVFIHFHSAPYTSPASQEKVIEIIRLLAARQSPLSLILVPFAEIQREIVAKSPSSFRVVLYRRLMLRIAEAIAKAKGAIALVTGESLGQVSSQTLENLTTIEAACSIPVLRPLLGADKVEIVNEARAIDTFEISIEPDQDCCQYLMPRRPATHSTPEDAEKAERRLDIPTLVEKALSEAMHLEIGAN